MFSLSLLIFQEFLYFEFMKKKKPVEYSRVNQISRKLSPTNLLGLFFLKNKINVSKI